LTRNLALLAGFNTIYWYCLVGDHFFSTTLYTHLLCVSNWKYYLSFL